jgi:predicted MPP superfamily phosphohydrolase
MPPTIGGPAGASLRLIAAGDGGEGPEERGSHLAQTIAAMRKIEDADAILLLGDNIYRCGVESMSDPNWQRVIAPLFAVGVPIYPVLGNHDWGSKSEIGCRISNPLAQVQKTGAPAFDLWRFPARSYIVQTDVAELIFFDSSPIASGWDDELANALCPLRAALAQPKSKPWRIVIAHHPIYSCGAHGDDESTRNLRARLLPMFVEAEVDLYVAGHDHDLELVADAPAGTPMLLVSGAASKIRRTGACNESASFKLEGGFAVIDVSSKDLEVNVYCNGSATPCMARSAQRVPIVLPPSTVARAR